MHIIQHFEETNTDWMFGWVVFKSGLYLCRWSGKLAVKMLYVLIRKKKCWGSNWYDAWALFYYSEGSALIPNIRQSLSKPHQSFTKKKTGFVLLPECIQLWTASLIHLGHCHWPNIHAVCLYWIAVRHYLLRINYILKVQTMRIC